jgi:hypothetical protein
MSTLPAAMCAPLTTDGCVVQVKPPQADQCPAANKVDAHDIMTPSTMHMWYYPAGTILCKGPAASVLQHATEELRCAGCRCCNAHTYQHIFRWQVAACLWSTQQSRAYSHMCHICILTELHALVVTPADPKHLTKCPSTTTCKSLAQSLLA